MRYCKNCEHYNACTLRVTDFEEVAEFCTEFKTKRVEIPIDLVNRVIEGMERIDKVFQSEEMVDMLEGIVAELRDCVDRHDTEREEIDYLK